MIREFVMTTLFDAKWKEQESSDDDLRLLQDELLRNPKKGNVIQGTGGFRKLRYPLPGRGKSGGVRIVYLDIEECETLYLIHSYPKSKKDTLKKVERNELNKLSSAIKKGLQERKGKEKSRV